jgi:hypothetical protein
VNFLIQKDTGFKSVLTTIQQTSTEYTSASAQSVQVQVLSDTVTKYNVVVEVAERKEEKVYIYNNVTKVVDLQATVIIPAVIKPLVVVEKITAEQTTVVSNQIEKLTVSYPQTTTVLAEIRKEIPNIQIDTVMVTAHSNSSQITLVSTSTTGKELIINKYFSSEETVAKIS